jgi:hypothetical protein
MRVILVPVNSVHKILKGTQKKLLIPYNSRVKPFDKSEKLSFRYWDTSKSPKQQVEFAQMDLYHAYRVTISLDKIRFNHESIKWQRTLRRLARLCGHESFRHLIGFMVTSKIGVPGKFYMIGWKEVEFTLGR